MILIVNFLPVSSINLTTIKSYGTQNEKNKSFINKTFTGKFTIKEERISKNVKCGDSVGYDLEITGFNCWNSPWPNDDEGLLCFNILVVNTGDNFTGSGEWIKITMYKIYNDREFKWKINNWTYVGFDYGHYMHWMIADYEDKKLVALRAEVETSIAETNKTNNIMTVSPALGVTIRGVTYYEEVSGDKTPIDYVYLVCKSDDSYFLSYYTDDTSCWGGIYSLFAPIKPGDPPYTYDIKAYYDSKNLSITTEPLYGYEYTNLDIVFGVKCKLANNPLLLRVFERFPLLARLSNSL